MVRKMLLKLEIMLLLIILAKLTLEIRELMYQNGMVTVITGQPLNKSVLNSLFSVLVGEDQVTEEPIMHLMKIIMAQKMPVCL